MVPINNASSFHLLCVLLLILLTGGRQVAAQQVDPGLPGSDTIQPSNSCTSLLSSGSGDYVRLLPRIGDTAPVNVQIALQIGDDDPCYLDRVTPVELHFPRSSFSFRIEPQEEGALYRFILNKTGTGPVVWFSEIGEICVVVDEAWKYKIGCEEINY